MCGGWVPAPASPVQVEGGRVVICGEGDAGVEDHPEVAMG